MRGGSTIPLHIGSRLQYDAENDRVSNRYINELLKQPVLERQGDGMRSFASIIMNVLTAEQTISLIDEPEAFLHPPQARLLGKMLVKNKPNDRQLFISTHSEDFLKGILDSDSQNIKIVRINREENINKINVLGNTDITELWSNPLLRYSNILSGLFHRKVVVCESDTDCRFYQAVMNAMFDGEEHVSPDILFTHCGGKDRIHTVVSALRSLNVNVVATPDIDILNDKRKFEIITTSFGVNWADISTYWTVIDNYVKSQRHQLTTEEVKSKIEEILFVVTDTSLPKDTAREINKTVKMASAWTKIKATGITFFSGTSAYTAFQEIDKICRPKGLFIVPEGEIESFCRVVQGHSNDWLNDVLIRDLKAGEEFEQARRFVNDIIQ
ncbi:MAG: AAA family ATPase [Rikenellaceae bacterium]